MFQLSTIALKQSINRGFLYTKFQAEHIQYKEYQEGRGIHAQEVALPHAVEHAAEDEEHGEEDGVSGGPVAYLLGLLALVLGEGEEYHQCAQHHQQLGAFFVEEEVCVRHPPHHQHQEREEQGDGYHKIA